MSADQLNQSLTVENFVQKIKAMDNRERKRLRAETLIELIVQLPEEVQDLSKTVQDLLVSVNQIQKAALENAMEITKLKDENTEIKMINADMSRDVKKLVDDNNTLKIQVESIETYLRVNNIEITGLGNPLVTEESEDEEAYEEATEEMILECLNGLVEGNNLVTAKDIDICHELPSKSGGRTHVVKFVSRKAKNKILNAKKSLRNYNYKFRENSIYINDHLTPTNKHLFALAKQKKSANGYKYLWTRNGKILMRKDEMSPIIAISSVDIIANL